MIHPINGRTQLHLYPFFMEPFYSYSRTDYRMSQLNEVNSNGRYYTSGVACVPSFPTYRSCVLLHIASTESQVIESPKRRRSPSIYRVYTTLLLQSTGTASSYKRLQRERSHERLMWDVGVKWRNYIYRMLLESQLTRIREMKRWWKTITKVQLTALNRRAVFCFWTTRRRCRNREFAWPFRQRKVNWCTTSVDNIRIETRR